MRNITLVFAFCTLTLHAQYLAEGRYLHRTGSSNTYTITTDLDGNILVGGQVLAPTDFNPGDPLAAVQVLGTQDSYLCKLDPTGAFLWVAVFSGNESQVDWLQDAITDAAGNIYAVGCFGNATDFDPGPGVVQVNGGTQDGYLVKLSPAGELIWVKDIGAGGTDGLFGVDMNAAGDIIVSGYVDYDATIDNNTFALNNTVRGGLVASFQPDGTFNWARVLPGGDSRNVTDVCVAPDGGIHGGGIFSGTLDLDPGPDPFPVVATGNADGFYFKLDATGNFLWGGRFGGTLEDWCYDVDVDADGATYLAGHFRDAATIGYGTDVLAFNAGTASDALIARIDPDGTPAWVHGIPGNGRSHSVRATTNGEVVYNGYFSNTADFDPGAGVAELTTQGGNDMFLARYTASGTFMEVLAITGTSGQLGRGMYLDAANVIHAAGSSSSVIDLDPGTAVLADTSQGTASFYVRLQASGPNSISDHEAYAALYPNPVCAGAPVVTGFATGHVRVRDAAGRVCAHPGVVPAGMPLALDLPPGSYLLEWTDGRMQLVRRLVVQ